MLPSSGGVRRCGGERGGERIPELDDDDEFAVEETEEVVESEGACFVCARKTICCVRRRTRPGLSLPSLV